MRRHGDASPARLALALVMVSLAIGCARSVRLEPADARMACRAGRVDDRTIGPEVEWWQPAGRAQRQRLDAWCATVGPAVIQRPAEHAALATTVPVVDRLVVLTWNMHVGDGDLRRLVRDLRAGTLTGGRVPDGVVLLLQEARRVGAEVPAVLASALDLHLFYAPGMRNGRGRGAAARDDRGSAIVSSLPLSRLQALELPLERQRRVALGATLTGATRSGRGWSVRLVDVHLENRPGPGRLWVRAAAARTRQMAALRRVLPGDGALVIGGDLNTWRGDGEGALRQLATLFEPWPEEDTRATFGARLRLDYLYGRLPRGVVARHRRLDDRYGSDHAPVLAEIDWAAPEQEERP